MSGIGLGNVLTHSIRTIDTLRSPGFGPHLLFRLQPARLLTQETPDPGSGPRPPGKDSEGREGSQGRWEADVPDVFHAGHPPQQSTGPGLLCPPGRTREGAASSPMSCLRGSKLAQCPLVAFGEPGEGRGDGSAGAGSQRTLPQQPWPPGWSSQGPLLCWCGPVRPPQRARSGPLTPFIP